MNENHLYFEIYILLIVLGLQLFAATDTGKNIWKLFTTFNWNDFLSIKKITINRDKLAKKDIKEFVNELRESVYNSRFEKFIIKYQGSQKKNNLTLNLLINYNESHPVFDTIVDSINVYLIRNSGSAADFNLIADIVERNYDAVDEKVSVTVASPLYLGLIGTMVGIIIGLAFMPSLEINGGSISGGISVGIGQLIKGVALAMTASMFGLFLTILNSSLFYRIAKGKSQSQKNEFFLFLQMELMPLLSQSVNTNVFTLNQNIGKFNQSFSENIDKLSSEIGKSLHAIEIQQDTIEIIKEINPEKVTEINIRLFEELNQGLEELSEFNEYLQLLSENAAMLDSAGKNLRIFSDRTVAFEDIATGIRSGLEDNHKLQEYLTRIFSDLDYHKDMAIESVGGVQESIGETIERFGQTLNNTIERLNEDSAGVLADYQKNLTSITEQLNALYTNAQTTFEDGQRYLQESIEEQMSSFKTTLNEQTERISAILRDQPITVEHYQTLLSDVKEYVQNSNKVNEALATKVNNMNVINDDVVDLLRKIEYSQHNFRNFFNNIWQWIKGLFGRS